jgi:sulfur carrier protein
MRHILVTNTLYPRYTDFATLFARPGTEFCTGNPQAAAPRFLAPSVLRAHTPRMQTAVTLTLNGEARAFDGPMTVAALLATLGLETRKVAVERNETIVPRSSYAETWLQSGDALEIVHFIGGG